MFLVLLACAGAPADTAAPGRPASCDTGLDVTWESFGEGFFATYCLACHSATTPDRAGAPAESNFDRVDEVRAQAAAIRARVIEEETMPVGGGVSEDDLLLLARLLDCGL